MTLELKNALKAAGRFGSYVDERGRDECWPWTRCRHKDGYGRFSLSNRIEQAHRVAFAIGHRKDIPDGMVVMHRCDNPPCCNPRHLRLGTQEENIMDRVKKGRGARGRRPRIPTAGNSTGFRLEKQKELGDFLRRQALDLQSQK